MLDGVVVAGVASLAGGGVGVALRLGVSMTLLQLAIGTVNDVADAPADAGLKPGKPIPAGLVPAAGATALAVAFGLIGVGMAVSVSPPVGALAVFVIGIGLVYDLRAKGTAWSWLPFAVGIPLLPVYGWLGATGDLHPMFRLLVPAAIACGTALAIANGLVDTERDRAVGRSSIAVALGLRRAGLVATLLFGVVAVAAAATSPPGSAVGLAVLLTGTVLMITALAGWRLPPDGRELAWRVEAAGTALLAIAWVLGQVRGTSG